MVLGKNHWNRKGLLCSSCNLLQGKSYFPKKESGFVQKSEIIDSFTKLFEAADVQLIDVFGDYKLRKFNKNTSERLIMIFTQSYE